MAIATSQDVEAELLRPLTTTETTYLPRLLSRVERLLRRRIADLDERIGDGGDQEFTATVSDVAAAALARVFRNPEAKVQESDGTYSYQLNRLVASGMLTIEDDEWSLLGVADRVTSVAPATDAYLTSRRGQGAHEFQTHWPAREELSQVVQ